MLRRNLYADHGGYERRVLLERRELPIGLMRDVASKLRRAATDLAAVIEDVGCEEGKAEQRVV